jgi:hypothetical protein
VACPNREPLRRRRRIAVVAAAAAAIGVLSGCSGTPAVGADISTFALKVGDCLNPPSKITAQLSTVRVVPCSSPHTEEAYATVDYTGTAAAKGTVYPGDAVVQKFAQGACEQRYQGYVGDAYSDSRYFFTFLLPSARSWQDDDRTVICIFTTTGQQLHSSVKGSGL